MLILPSAQCFAQRDVTGLYRSYTGRGAIHVKAITIIDSSGGRRNPSSLETALYTKQADERGQ